MDSYNKWVNGEGKTVESVRLVGHPIRIHNSVKIESYKEEIKQLKRLLIA